MALSKKRLSIQTAADGSWSAEVHMSGALRAVAIDLGSGPTALSTPDLSITDDFDDAVLLAVAGIAANARYYPQVADTDPTDGTAGSSYVPAVVVTRMMATIAGGGDTKSGTLYLFVER